MLFSFGAYVIADDEKIKNLYIITVVSVLSTVLGTIILNMFVADENDTPTAAYSCTVVVTLNNGQPTVHKENVPALRRFREALAKGWILLCVDPLGDNYTLIPTIALIRFAEVGLIRRNSIRFRGKTSRQRAKRTDCSTIRSQQQG